MGTWLPQMLSLVQYLVQKTAKLVQTSTIQHQLRTAFITIILEIVLDPASTTHPNLELLVHLSSSLIEYGIRQE